VVFATAKESQGTPNGFGGRCPAFLVVVIDLTGRLQASVGDNLLNYRPTANQEGAWVAGTHLPFDPFVSSAVLTDLDVECPRCERLISSCK
jgi:hypothetical protein